MGSKQKRTTGQMIGNFFANLGRVILAFIMIGIMTGCIVASVLTVYILRYINADEVINLNDIQMKYTTIIYTGNPDDGTAKELQRLQTTQNRIWVPYEQIPRHMVDALVAIEDQRYWKHDGVDWKRTAGAFVNMFVPIYKNNAGGSTITQQLVKNVTGDDDYRIERKVQEIFRALNLNKNYTKEQILESYLNTVYFSNNAYGVQAAANTYFNKDVSKLTVAESASIIGITQFPGKWDPFVNPDKNKKRQEDILFVMNEQGWLDDAAYEAALVEKLDFKKASAQERVAPTYTYFVDHVFEEVIDDLQEQGYALETAQQMVTSGGLRIYATCDVAMQDKVTEFYSSAENFPQTVYNKEYPQSACVVTDLNGRILALAGGIGEKKGMREYSRATQSLRQSGSAIKPLAAYLQGFENDLITWSTIMDDSPIIIKQNGVDISWPVNFQGKYVGPMTIDRAIQESRNTIPVKLVQQVGERRVFDFLHDKLAFHSLIEQELINGGIVSDINLSSMALGGMTKGVTTLEMAGGYQIYGNGGYFTKPYSYTEVRDYEGNVILKTDTTPRRVITAETAAVMNKLLQRVTAGPWGTGTPAKWGAMPVAGKTGTSTANYDQWFVGVTPYYVGTIWMGYDTPASINYSNYPPPLTFKALMSQLHEGLEVKEFPTWGKVVQKTYCTTSGELAIPGCTSVSTGWYKESNIPRECSYHSGMMESVDLDGRPSRGDDDEEDPGDKKKPIFSRDNSSSSKSSSSRRSDSGLLIINDDD